MKMRKLFASIAAAATMLAGLAVGATTANAVIVGPDDDPSNTANRTVTLNAEDAQQFTSHTYKAVKIASYDVYGTSPDQSLTLVTEADPVKTAVTKALKAAGYEVPATATDPLAAAQQLDSATLDQSDTFPFNGDGSTRTFADALRDDSTLTNSLQNVTLNDVANSDGLKKTITFDTPGLWLILDQNAVDDSSSKSLPILVGTPLTLNAGTGTEKVYAIGEIAVKNQILPVKKVVTDQTVAAGENANYTINTNIPNYIGHYVNGYEFTVSDKFGDDAPLEYVAGTLKVYVAKTADADEDNLPEDDNDDWDVLSSDLDYTVTGFAANSKSFTIDMSTYIRTQAFTGQTVADDSKFDKDALAGKQVIVKYSAKVTGSTGTAGAANAPGIKYPNDPSDNTKSDTIPGDPEKVFNFDYKLVKRDKTTQAPLSGVKFTIKKVNGTEGKVLAYEPSSGWSEVDAPAATATGTENGVFTTDTNGEITFLALADNIGDTTSQKYTITELAPASGYFNPGVSFNFTLQATVTNPHTSSATASATYAIDADGVGSDTWGLVSGGNAATVTVDNVKNITELPLTGGAGIALFSVIGLLLVGAAFTVYAKMRSTKKALLV
ncbi:Fimbrial subunit FimA [Bifidobacterium lemurum]|uniref:Fimbrial subunit FimA n=1 Tax=Bifidobacterium lemurum TaxID=1603886 RepID=A0A261FUX4_9BIFI|nr:SpaA isopeptide-forming pilin-related protein [Bifidobacterium lemurum]OZG62970.1 Fimbrial subunit FimA [Bifidobacterium lemurum]QOL33321.1 isopeptide-forming domain-containing fimbrial protein [Bifidobacterium lemurum]